MSERYSVKQAWILPDKIDITLLSRVKLKTFDSLLLLFKDCFGNQAAISFKPHESVVAALYVFVRHADQCCRLQALEIVAAGFAHQQGWIICNPAMFRNEGGRNFFSSLINIIAPEESTGDEAQPLIGLVGFDKEGLRSQAMPRQALLKVVPFLISNTRIELKNCLMKYIKIVRHKNW